MSILETLGGERPVCGLTEPQLPQLCGEIRRFLVENIAESGGHLASNLGVVELTVAIHRVYDSARDRIIFDVGHQCYAHKLLTGRMDGFRALRGYGAMSGFPKPSESLHDAFVAGHASTSISVALGMARARTLLGDTYKVACVIGDGALTGGLAYEALNDAGQSAEPHVVILNDNEMSITRNVGGIARHLSSLRNKHSYYRFKKIYHKILSVTPAGRHIDKFLHKIKTGLKNTLLPSSLFESMGYAYLGPVDGHDTVKLTSMLNRAVEMNKPVLLHVNTVKGKGYIPSERDPSAYHGVSGFAVHSGELKTNGGSFSGVFGKTLAELAGADNRIVAITAAMCSGTGLEPFAARFPKRFFDVGIAEAHAVTMAAAMACKGLVPVCAIYSTFLQRAYDSILHDAALAGAHVIFAVDRAGIVGEDGETHQGIFDVSFLSGVPGLTLFAPSSYAELRAMLRTAIYDCSGPVAIRYPRGGEGIYKEDCASAVIKEGSDITLVAYGIMVNRALEAASLCPDIAIEIIKPDRISPLYLPPIEKSLRKTRRLLCVEDCVESGSIGLRLKAELAGRYDRAVLLNTGARFIPQGKPAELEAFCGIDAESIAFAARQLVNACES